MIVQFVALAKDAAPMVRRAAVAALGPLARAAGRDVTEKVSTALSCFALLFFSPASCVACFVFFSRHGSLTDSLPRRCCPSSTPFAATSRTRCGCWRSRPPR